MEPAALKSAVLKAGGLRYTHEKIDRLYKKTHGAINLLDIGAGKRELLLRLLKKAAGIPA
jgi:hypothetical protein